MDYILYLGNFNLFDFVFVMYAKKKTDDRLRFKTFPLL